MSLFSTSSFRRLSAALVTFPYRGASLCPLWLAFLTFLSFPLALFSSSSHPALSHPSLPLPLPLSPDREMVRSGTGVGFAWVTARWVSAVMAIWGLINCVGPVSENSCAPQSICKGTSHTSSCPWPPPSLPLSHILFSLRTRIHTHKHTLLPSTHGAYHRILDLNHFLKSELCLILQCN